MLSKADPRAKLAVVAMFSTLAVLYGGILPLLVLAVSTFFAMIIFGCDLKRGFGKIKSFLSVIIFMSIVQSIFTRGGEPFIYIGNVTIMTKLGFIAAAGFVLRMTIIALSASILATSSGREIIQGLVQLKVPYEIAFMSSMGIKFLPSLREQFKDVMVAMELRGIDFSKAHLLEKLKLMSAMFTPVVAGAIVNSRQVSISVQLRGFRAYQTRTSHFTLKFSQKDRLIVVATAILSVIFIYWQATI